jgi:hypothetical protein
VCVQTACWQISLYLRVCVTVWTCCISICVCVYKEYSQMRDLTASVCGCVWVWTYSWFVCVKWCVCACVCMRTCICALHMHLDRTFCMHVCVCMLSYERADRFLSAWNVRRSCVYLRISVLIHVFGFEHGCGHIWQKCEFIYVYACSCMYVCIHTYIYLEKMYIRLERIMCVCVCTYIVCMCVCVCAYTV